MQVNRDIRNAKKLYWSSYFQESKNDMKKNMERYQATCKY